MAEKKTTRKVLSDRALELVMLNVLGRLGSTMPAATTADDARGELGAGSATSDPEAEPADQKLNS